MGIDPMTFMLEVSDSTGFLMCLLFLSYHSPVMGFRFFQFYTPRTVVESDWLLRFLGKGQLLSKFPINSWGKSINWISTEHKNWVFPVHSIPFRPTLRICATASWNSRRVYLSQKMDDIGLIKQHNHEQKFFSPEFSVGFCSVFGFLPLFSGAFFDLWPFLSL